jgi:molybdopterin-containing oxidoreductase family iron-sulfur binding subunit
MLAADADGGAGVRLLVEASSSPARADLKQRLKAKYANLQVVEYESISWDNQGAGLKRLFGRSVRPVYALSYADTILCLDDDLLALHPGAVAHSYQFASRRRPESGGMARLYAVESRMSQTRPSRCLTFGSRIRSSPCC